MDLILNEKFAPGNFMSSEDEADRTQAELKQLWSGEVPPLTPEQIDIALQLWRKIKARREREQK
jgi:hypothetical protein